MREGGRKKETEREKRCYVGEKGERQIFTHTIRSTHARTQTVHRECNRYECD